MDFQECFQMKFNSRFINHFLSATLLLAAQPGSHSWTGTRASDRHPAHGRALEHEFVESIGRTRTKTLLSASIYQRPSHPSTQPTFGSAIVCLSAGRTDRRSSNRTEFGLARGASFQPIRQMFQPFADTCQRSADEWPAHAGKPPSSHQTSEFEWLWRISGEKSGQAGDHHHHYLLRPSPTLPVFHRNLHSLVSVWVALLFIDAGPVVAIFGQTGSRSAATKKIGRRQSHRNDSLWNQNLQEMSSLLVPGAQSTALSLGWLNGDRKGDENHHGCNLKCSFEFNQSIKPFHTTGAFISSALIHIPKPTEKAERMHLHLNSKLLSYERTSYVRSLRVCHFPCPLVLCTYLNIVNQIRRLFELPNTHTHVMFLDSIDANRLGHSVID